MPSLDELVREGLPLVELLARQLKRTLRVSMPVEDLESAGREALFAAARGFDPKHGVPFRRYANLRVRGGMLDWIRSNGSVPRKVYARVRALEAVDHVEASFSEHRETERPASAQAADAEIGDFLAKAATAAALGFMSMRPIEDASEVAETSEGAFDRVARTQLAEAIQAAIAERPEEERHLLKRHYFDGIPFDEASRELGLSKSWGCRIHARALEGIAKYIKRNKVET